MKATVTRWVEIEVTVYSKQDYNKIAELIHNDTYGSTGWWNGVEGTWESKVPEHVARLVEDYVDSLGRDGA